jgi:tetratricopeptide (TPR) repeat protein
MPDQARILRFPGRPSKARSAADAQSAARDYLSISAENRAPINEDALYGDLDILLALCGQLREMANSDPKSVLAEAERVFAWVSRQGTSLGYFDERDYFLGESALLSGIACRQLGDKAATELWLDRADASYRHTINPAPSLARVAYARLTMRYDMGRYTDVLELLPSVALSFEKLGLYSELGKCHFLEAMSLMQLGRSSEAVPRLQTLVSGPEFRSEEALRGQAMMSLGNIHSDEGDQEQALAVYKTAQPLLERGQRYAALADMKAAVAETLRRLGRIAAAVEAYRETVIDYVRLGMQTRVAYVRVVLAEALLEAGRPREAEWELLAAFPTINEQQMVPEGFAAVVLLQESVRQRKTDPQALSELRQYLQTAN